MVSLYNGTVILRRHSTQTAIISCQATRLSAGLCPPPIRHHISDGGPAVNQQLRRQAHRTRKSLVCNSCAVASSNNRGNPEGPPTSDDSKTKSVIPPSSTLRPPSSSINAMAAKPVRSSAPRFSPHRNTAAIIRPDRVSA